MSIREQRIAFYPTGNLLLSRRQCDQRPDRERRECQSRIGRFTGPANRLSQRGLGTLNRTDPVWLNLQKTRLFDPALSFLGNNEHPGEFRQLKTAESG